MFELTISTGLDKQAYISKLYKMLEPEIKSFSGLIIKQNRNRRTYLSLAVKKDKKEYFKAKIIDFVVFMIIDDYKCNFFKENLSCQEDNILYQSFLKAISIFDADADRDFILKQIDFSNDILVDSFYHFKLQELKERWQKTAHIINLNQILKNKTSMIEILKYLTTMSDNVVSIADVEISKSKLKVKRQDKIKNFKNNFLGLSNFLTEIIEMNPAKINLNLSDESGDEIVEVLTKIFYDKINF